MSDDLAAHGLLDIPISDKAAIAFLDAQVVVRDERIAKLEAVIREADDFLNLKGDPIAAHIVLRQAVEAMSEPDPVF